MREADIDIRLMDYYLSELINNNKLHDGIDTKDSPSTASGRMEEKLTDDTTDAH
ncbi:MAG: hypothetical protein RIG61_10945 [Deltaproteobacteria bacterium]